MPYRVSTMATMRPAPEDYWHRILDNLEVTPRAPAAPRRRRRPDPAPADTPEARAARRREQLEEHRELRYSMHIYMAHYLGFQSTVSLAAWEARVALFPLAWFVRECLGRGHTDMPDSRGLVSFIDLEWAVEQQLLRLEECQNREEAMRVDTAGWKLFDYYKHVVVGIVAQDRWCFRHQTGAAALAHRGWSPQQLTIKMINFLTFLVGPWQHGPGAGIPRNQCALSFNP